MHQLNSLSASSEHASIKWEDKFVATLHSAKCLSGSDPRNVHLHLAYDRPGLEAWGVAIISIAGQWLVLNWFGCWPC